MSSHTSITMAAAAAEGVRSAFTVAQWHELEHQALILKYLLAGMRVPNDLIFPIQKSFDSLYSTSFFPNPALGYCSFYGKKVDPEPGRCKRTDGKKWRCAKDTYGDSKYCERHMHRGRNRSRKPVEPSQTTTSSQALLSATVSSFTVTGDNSNSSSISGGGGAAAGHYQNHPLHTFESNRGPAASVQSQLHLENIPYGIPHKDYRNLYGHKTDAGEHSLFLEASRKSLRTDSFLDSTWPLTSSQVSLFPVSRVTDYGVLQNDYPQHSFLRNEFGIESDPTKQTDNLIQPFFEEFPKSKGAWPSDLENEISKSSSISSTRLSISIPMGSSDFSATSSRSPIS